MTSWGVEHQSLGPMQQTAQGRRIRLGKMTKMSMTYMPITLMFNSVETSFANCNSVETAFATQWKLVFAITVATAFATQSGNWDIHET
jgi:hypothetical protein